MLMQINRQIFAMYMKTEIARNFFVKFPYIKFHENSFSDSGNVLKTD